MAGQEEGEDESRKHEGEPERVRVHHLAVVKMFGNDRRKIRAEMQAQGEDRHEPDGDEDDRSQRGHAFTQRRPDRDGRFP